MKDEEDHRDHHDEVNQTAGDMKDQEPAQPGDKQNDGDDEQHRKDPPDAALCILYTDLAAVARSRVAGQAGVRSVAPGFSRGF